MTPGNPDQEEG